MTVTMQPVSRIALIGGGVHAAVVTDCIRESEHATVAGYVDLPEHDPSTMRQMDVPYLGTDDDVRRLIADGAITSVMLGLAGLDHTLLRITLAEKMDRLAATSWTAIHSTAVVAETVSVGSGTVVFAGAIINPLARVGRHAVINTGAVVEHHAVLDDFAVISPRATLCGGVRIGRGAFVGAGAVIITGVTIGADSVVAAGAVVLKDVPPGATIMGNPGRVRETNNLTGIETALAR